MSIKNTVALALGLGLISTSVLAIAAPVQAGGSDAEMTSEPMVTEEMTTMEPTIVDIAAGNEDFETLVAAIQAAGLTETLANGGEFTVFAPTDEAFAALPAGTLEYLLLPENKDVLVQILTYHVVPGTVTSGDLTEGAVATVEGSEVMVSLADGVTVNGANVITADVMASNGVIHAIDQVILPPSLQAEAETDVDS